MNFGHVQPVGNINPLRIDFRAANDGDLESALNQEAMVALRSSIRAGERAECVGCVCSLYREPGNMDESLLP